MRLIRWREFPRYRIANRYRFVVEDIQDYLDYISVYRSSRRNISWI
jgi:hypothetical protein